VGPSIANIDQAVCLSYFRGNSSVGIPVSLEIFGQLCFSQARGCRNSKWAFLGSRLKALVVPASAEVISGLCLTLCSRLTSVKFENGSVLQRMCQLGDPAAERHLFEKNI
jgi:hypothetical protein